MNEDGKCKCGCGQTTVRARYSDKRWGTVRGEYVNYCRGHSPIIKHWKLSEETKRRQGLAKMGNKAPMKNPIFREKMRQGVIKHYQDHPEVKEILRQKTKEQFAKMTREERKAFGKISSERNSGSNNPMFGTKRNFSDEHRKKIREGQLRFVQKARYNGEHMSPRLGFTEKSILDNLEGCLSYPILRQHKVAGYFIDGYCPALNLAIEVDEKHHRRMGKHDKDVYRMNIIKDELHCKFWRFTEEGEPYAQF